MLLTLTIVHGQNVVYVFAVKEMAEMAEMAEMCLEFFRNYL
jgi:hypothetical protein